MIQNNITNDSREIFSEKKWIQPSIDEDYIPALNQKIVNGIYSINADEEIVISTETSQAWFWTEKWQAGERAVQSDIDTSKIHRFSNIEDLIASLGLEEDAGD